MGGLGWQDLTVGLMAAAALGWLLRRRLARRRPTPFCDDCPACGTSAATSPRRDGDLIPESELFRR